MYFSARMVLFKYIKKNLTGKLLEEWEEINKELSQIKAKHQDEEAKKRKTVKRIIDLAFNKTTMHTIRMCQNSPIYLSKFVSGNRYL